MNRISKMKGHVLSEVVAAITCIAILTHITSWYTSSKEMQAQAQEGYDFSVRVASNVVDYYGSNTSYPVTGTYNYGTNPGEYVASVNYIAPTATTYGYVQATFRSDNLNVVLQDKWIILRLIVSGSHLTYNCYTNVNASFMSGTVLSAGSYSEIVGNSCDVADTVASVININ